MEIGRASCRERVGVGGVGVCGVVDNKKGGGVAGVGWRERGVRESKTKERKGKAGDGGALEEEEGITREGEVMKTGAVEIESFLIFRTIFQVSAYSLMFSLLQLCNSLCFY